MDIWEIAFFSEWTVCIDKKIIDYKNNLEIWSYALTFGQKTKVKFILQSQPGRRSMEKKLQIIALRSDKNSSMTFKAKKKKLSG